MQIHINRAGQNFGPYTPDEVRSYVAAGQIAATDLAWHDGMSEWKSVESIVGINLPVAAPPMIGSGTRIAQVQPLYHHVSILKFVIFSICSCGLYHIYWFYKNWQFIRDRDNLSISPFWRAFFGVFWCQPLVKDVLETRGGNPGTAWAVFLPFFALNVAWRLPDPYWLVTYFTFVPLIYVVRQINLINEERSARAPYYSRFSVWSILASLVGALFLALAVFGTLMPGASTKVVTGTEMTQTDIGFLRSEKVLNESEQVLYFYSTGLFSIKEEGNILTDQRVISYYTEGEERVIESSTFDNIEDIDVAYSDSTIEDTQVTVYVKEGEEFYLDLSAEEKKDHAFVDKLMELWKAKQPAQ